jgi:hypothetical protein
MAPRSTAGLDREPVGQAEGKIVFHRPALQIVETIAHLGRRFVLEAVVVMTEDIAQVERMHHQFGAVPRDDGFDEVQREVAIRAADVPEEFHLLHDHRYSRIREDTALFGGRKS